MTLTKANNEASKPTALTRSYPAKHYIDTDNEASLREVINNNPLATLLFMKSDTTPHISYIPFHFDTTQTSENKGIVGDHLIAHVSNHHPLAKQLKDIHKDTDKETDKKINITLIFNGDDAYISPNYVSKENSVMQQVPTWDYARVHINGCIKGVIDHEEKYQQMEKSSHYFEQWNAQYSGHNTDNVPLWSLHSAPSKSISSMLKAITLFSVAITSVEGHFKLSQNKPTHVRNEIADNLDKHVNKNRNNSTGKNLDDIREENRDEKDSSALITTSTLAEKIRGL